MTQDAPRTSRHVEIERKFDVHEPAVPPSFAGMVGVDRVEPLPLQNLAAVYFDTATHDLASKRITLRRRTGGPDAGWHLKLPAGIDTRTEIHAPLAPAATGDQDPVPSELLALVQEIVGDRPLTPVATITTARQVQVLHGHEGTPLAEFCDDQVTARKLDPADIPGDPPVEQQWREWELELLSPAANTELLDRLSSRLLEAGAVPAGHGSKLARVLDS